MKETRQNVGELLRENRQQRAALESLLRAIEQSNAQVDTAAARERMPDPPGESDPIVPPGQRDDGPGNA